LNKRFDQATWYGRGPHENYQDRFTSAFVDQYKSDVKSLYFPYIRPQENGYRTDTRWLVLVDNSNNGIRLSAVGKTFSFSALNYTVEDFDEGDKKRNRHTTDLVARDFVNVNIDMAQMGVGGDNSWGAKPLSKYQIKPKDYSFSYILSPVTN
jgi:beta-galactosidase